MISLIIPAYNEEPLLGATLGALHAAGHALGESYELVVVDDASTDATAMVAQQHGARVVNVAHRQIAATRNSGARAALGELFIFVDADTLVNDAVVRCAVQAMRDGAAGGGAAVAFDGVVPFYAKLLLPIFIRLFRAAGIAAGCFLFCTRSAFETVGGFDESFYCAEEIIMSRALKRCGKFVVLRQSVTTSGRKLRTHRVAEMLSLVCSFVLRGSKALKQRQGTEIWYAERRDDPQLQSAAQHKHAE